MKTQTTTKRKTVKFEVSAKPNAKVFLAGSFNNWSATDKELREKDGDGYYAGTLLLEPGEYEYKFIIDGKWLIDTDNPNFNQNKLGTLNSIFNIATE